MNSCTSKSEGSKTINYFSNGVDFVDPISGYTPLMYAARQGKTEILRVLIERHANLDYQTECDNHTALMIASMNGNIDCVEELLRRGSSFNLIDKLGLTSLMHASKGGHNECVLLILKRGADQNLTDINGFTAAHFAAKFGHSVVIEYLHTFQSSLEIKDIVEYKTPLHLAAQYGRKDTVIKLIDCGAKVDQRSGIDKTTALILASKEGHKATVSLLLSRGADANLADRFGWTALHFASSWGRRDTALILLVDGKANVNSCETTLQGEAGLPPLIIAAKGSQIEILKLLLHYGADVNQADMVTGNSALACSAQLGLLNVVELLIRYHAEMNIQNNFTGTTALMLAAASGHRSVIIALLNNFADMTIVDHRGNNALMYAMKAGHREVLMSAIVQVTPSAKVNLIPWIQMECPHMIRGSLCGGPSVFLENILHSNKGIYSGLLNLGTDCDVYIIFCIVMLTVAAKVSADKAKKYNDDYSCDVEDLTNQINQLENMILRCLSAKSMCIDAVFNDTFVLGPQSCATLGRYNIRYFANAFVTGPLSLYIDNNLTKMLAYPKLREKIHQSMWLCLKKGQNKNCCRYVADTTTTAAYCSDTSSNSFGHITIFYQRSRYCPAVMLIMEGISKLLFLVVICWECNSFSSSSNNNKSDASSLRLLSDSQYVMIIMLISFLFYELGEMEEKLWAVSPSIVFNMKELQQKRLNAVKTHFIADPWKVADLSVYLLATVWFVLLLLSSTSTTSFPSIAAQRCLVLAVIPLTMGLLRYPAAFYPFFGQQLLTVFLLTYSLCCTLLIIIVFTCLSFGIVLYFLYCKELTEFQSPARSVQTIFNALLTNYDTTMFNEVSSDNDYILGLLIGAVFLLWTVFVLFNMIIGYIATNYHHVHDTVAVGWYMLIKAKQIQQFLLCFEKSPFCMLPPPLNLIPTCLYPFHVYHCWQARLFVKKQQRRYCTSIAGTASDYVLSMIFLFPVSVYECIAYCVSMDIGEAYKLLLLSPLCLPFGILYTVIYLIRNLFSCQSNNSSNDSCMGATCIVNSHLSDGRLRLSYGTDRDTVLFHGSSGGGGSGGCNNKTKINNNNYPRIDDNIFQQRNYTFTNGVLSPSSTHFLFSSSRNTYYNDIGDESDNSSCNEGVGTNNNMASSSNSSKNRRRNAVVQVNKGNDTSNDKLLSFAMIGKIRKQVTKNVSKEYISNKKRSSSSSFLFRKPNYIGKKIRIMPTSPFLQLSHMTAVADIDTIQAALPPTNSYKLSQLTQQRRQQQQTAQYQNSLPNKQHDSVDDELLKTPLPPLMLSPTYEEHNVFDDNKANTGPATMISGYQAGITTMAEYNHFMLSPDDSGVPTSQIQANKMDTSCINDENDNKALDASPHICNNINKHNAIDIYNNNNNAPNALEQAMSSTAALQLLSVQSTQTKKQNPYKLKQLQRQQQHINGNQFMYEASEIEVNELSDDPLLFYFPDRNKFPPMFLENERRAIFSEVLSEHYAEKDALTADAIAERYHKKSQLLAVSAYNKINSLEKKIEDQSLLIQQLLLRPQS